jgi:membrane associated rhomboid family serine protease
VGEEIQHGESGPSMGWWLAVLRRAPFSLGFLAVLWAVGLATASVENGPSAQLAERVAVGVPALAQGRWWTALTSALWCGGMSGYLFTTVLMLAVGLFAEHRLGSVRAGVVFATCTVVGALAGTGLVAVGSLVGEWWSTSLNDALAVGASPGAVGVLLALSWRCSTLWRRRLRLVLLISLGMLVLYSGQLQDVVRMMAGVSGLLLAGALVRPAWRRVGAPSRPEARLLLALVTSASAVGPLIAVASGTSVGPLSSLRYVFVPAVPSAGEIAEVCADGASVVACHSLQSQVAMDGFAAAFTALTPVLLALVLAEGLRRGRVSALWTAVVVNVVLTIFGAVSLAVAPDLVATILRGAQSYQDLEVLLGVTVATLQPLALAALLVWHRDAFDVAAPQRTYRRLSVVIGGVLAGLSVVFVVGGMLVAGQFAQPPGIDDLLAELPWRFIPPGYVDEPGSLLRPVGVLATLLYDWTGAIFWAVVLLGAWRAFWGSHIYTGDDDAGRARSLLVQHAAHNCRT